MRRRPHATARRRLPIVLGLLALLAGPATVLAHPLGNFTINHYAGIRIEPERVLLDVVIDEAEIPAFQSRQAIDVDGDDEVSDGELIAGAETGCRDLAGGLVLRLGEGAPLGLELVEAGLSFPIGATGLSTLRQVCVYAAALPAPLTAEGPTRITFADTTRPERIGWRELVVVGVGAAVTAVEGELRPTSISARLSIYPADLISRPLSDMSVTVDAVADPTVTAPPFDVPDAAPIGGAAASAPPRPGASASPGASAAPGASSTPSTAAVPGGIGGELPTIFREADLTPIVVLLSIVSAFALGAGHAVTPGHGKTLMAAYLVGTRGTPLHALGLGLSVSVSHTVGILALAAIVVGAADVLPPDVVVRTAPLIAALSILAIGAWMLFGEWRRRRATSAEVHRHGDAHDHSHDHDHPGHEHDQAAEHPHAAEHDHDGGGSHRHEESAAEDRPDAAGEHSHGGVRHSHLPPPGSTITWRSLF
ncbi:MAG: hypothetical protein ABIQ58_10410, partial [Candidatus Limnocylindrales bacterium]